MREYFVKGKGRVLRGGGGGIRNTHENSVTTLIETGGGAGCFGDPAKYHVRYSRGKGAMLKRFEDRKKRQGASPKIRPVGRNRTNYQRKAGHLGG